MYLNCDILNKVKPRSDSICLAPYCIPMLMCDKVLLELIEMTRVGVRTPVLEPTEWESSIVATHKQTMTKFAYASITASASECSSFPGLPCAIILDNITVGQKEQKDHNGNLRKVLKEVVMWVASWAWLMIC